MALGTVLLLLAAVADLLMVLLVVLVVVAVEPLNLSEMPPAMLAALVSTACTVSTAADFTLVMAPPA